MQILTCSVQARKLSPPMLTIAESLYIQDCKPFVVTDNYYVKFHLLYNFYHIYHAFVFIVKVAPLATLITIITHSSRFPIIIE